MLLEVIEADHGIDPVPIEDPIFNQIGFNEFAVNLFLIEDVEDGLEQD